MECEISFPYLQTTMYIICRESAPIISIPMDIHLLELFIYVGDERTIMYGDAVAALHLH